MTNRLRQAATSASVPALYTVAFIGLMVLWRVLQFPDPKHMFDLMCGWYSRYGVWIVLVAGFVEGLVLVNLYFPGSAVIMLGVVAAKGDPFTAALVVACASAAFILSAQCNYALGYWGLHRLITLCGGRRFLQRARIRYERHGEKAIAFSYVHPNIGAFVAVASGIAHLSWFRFVVATAPAIVVWNALWGVFIYNLANSISQAATDPRFLLLAFVLWTSVVFFLALLQNAGDDPTSASTTQQKKGCIPE